MASISEGDLMIEAFWTRFSPLRGIRDASQGSFEQRAAAYRHNRSMRKELLACMGRWALTSAVALLVTSYLQTQGAASSLFTAVAGLFATVGVCILAVGTCAYLHLAYDER
jgi:hypothetical protein